MVVAATALAATFAGASGLNTHTGKNCTGVQRWEVKTLQDEGASQIDLPQNQLRL